MRRAKLILPATSGRSTLDGSQAKLVDAETGQELECLRDIRIDVPLEGIITANVDIIIAEIEVSGVSKLNAT